MVLSPHMGPFEQLLPMHSVHLYICARCKADRPRANDAEQQAQ